MKRILSALVLTFFCILSVFSIELDVTATNGNFRAYDAYGKRIESTESSLDLEGIVIIANEEVTFRTVYGDITLGEGSIFNIISTDLECPTFYLVTGSAIFDLNEDFDIAVYTPVTYTSIFTAGSYHLVSDDNAEDLYNLSEGYALVYDGLTGVTYIIEPETYSSLTNGILNDPLNKEEIEVVPSEPTIDSVVRRINAPSAPKLYVKESSYIPAVPALPAMMYDAEIAVPTEAELYVLEQYIDIIKDEIPASLSDITYEELLAPSVTVMADEKKTGTN